MAVDEPEGFPEDVSIEVFLNSGFFFSLWEFSFALNDCVLKNICMCLVRTGWASYCKR